MARVTSTSREGKELVVRTDPKGNRIIESFHIRLYRELNEVGAVELRVTAEESRELVLDKLYAARPQAPGQAVVARPETARRPDIPTAARRPFKHTPLAESTVERKVAREQDGRKLIEKGDYTYGIEVFKGVEAGETYYTVRPKPGKHPSGLTHRVLAAMLEDGTSKMPKRPHWGPTLRQVKEIVKGRRKKLRAEALRRALRKKAG